MKSTCWQKFDYHWLNSYSAHTTDAYRHKYLPKQKVLNSLRKEDKFFVKIVQKLKSFKSIRLTYQIISYTTTKPSSFN